MKKPAILMMAASLVALICPALHPHGGLLIQSCEAYRDGDVAGMVR